MDFETSGLDKEDYDSLNQFLLKKIEEIEAKSNEEKALTNKVAEISSKTNEKQLIKSARELENKIAAGRDSQPVTAAMEPHKHKTLLQIKKMIQVQRVLEQDESLGVPEAQAALEVINAFNVDMVAIQANLAEMASLVNQAMLKVHDDHQKCVEAEQMVIETVRRQADLDADIETISQLVQTE